MGGIPGICKEYNPFFWHAITGLRLYACLHQQLLIKNIIITWQKEISK